MVPPEPFRAPLRVTDVRSQGNTDASSDSGGDDFDDASWVRAAAAAVAAATPGGSASVVTDAPVDEASSVVVQFSGVAFKRAGAAPEVVQNLTPSPRQLDLLQYQGGRAALLLDGVTLPAGDYQWIRLIVDNEPDVRDSYIVLTGGEECELRVPSGAESGLKLMRGFTLPADGSVALTVDFDLRKSIHAPPGQRSWRLRRGLPDAADVATRRRCQRRRDRGPRSTAS